MPMWVLGGCRANVGRVTCQIGLREQVVINLNYNFWTQEKDRCWKIERGKCKRRASNSRRNVVKIVNDGGTVGIERSVAEEKERLRLV